MTLYFTPPTAPLVPAAVKPGHPGFPLFRHYRNYDAGINVWIVAGQVTTQEPDFEFVTPEAEFLGGHINTVTPAQAALLVAAGFTVIESAPPVVTPGLPGFEDVFGDTVLSDGQYGFGGYGDFNYGGFEAVIGLYDEATYDESFYERRPQDGLPGFEDTYGDVPDGPDPVPNDPPVNDSYDFYYRETYASGEGLPSGSTP